MLEFFDIVLKSGPARRVDLGPGRHGAGTGPGLRKKKTRGDLVKSGQKSGYNSVNDSGHC